MISRRGAARMVALACALALLGTGTAAAAEASETTTTNRPKGKPILVGQIIAIDAGALSQEMQAAALKASVEAYNRRGGVLGRPIKLVQCDTKGDPNTEADCAREMAKRNVVATIADSTTANPAAVNEILTGAGIPRVGLQQNSLADYQNPIGYSLGAGGIGTTIAALELLTNNGNEKVSLVLPDVPAAAALPGLLGPGVEAAGGDIVNHVAIPAGATDYSLFVRAAEQNGATGSTATLGEAQGNQVLRAAQQLSTDLAWTASSATFTADDMKEVGDLARKMRFTDVVPAPTSQKEFPALKRWRADMKASGDKRLEDVDTMTGQAVLPWVALHGFVTVLDGAAPATVTAATVNDAFRNAVDVDMLGLIPPWTPGKRSTTLFENVSNPMYYETTFNGKRFVTKKKQIDVLAYAFPEG